MCTVYRVIITRFYLAFHFIILCILSLFIIRIVWWVRWIWQRRIWQTWIWILVIWYFWYLIGWLVAWLTIYFRCPVFCWWVMRRWRRVTCYPIKSICEAGTAGGVCTKFITDFSIFSITRISAELCIDPMFV